MPNNNIQEDQTVVNIDEIEPDSAGAPETGDPDEPECNESPTGQHEFDTSDSDPEVEACVYCGKQKN